MAPEIVHFDGNVTIGYFDHHVAGEASAISSEHVAWLSAERIAHRASECPGSEKCRAARNGNAAAAETSAASTSDNGDGEDPSDADVEDSSAGSNAGPFTCSVVGCGKSFASERALAAHVGAKHKE